MPQPFAHGDLKPDNILVKEDGTLVLVDYDGMYVPAMKGQKERELGSPDFRHPGRTEDVFDEHIDDFSLASILLSLKAIALQPDLLEEYGASDRLLFSEKDYRNLSESKVMDVLKPLMQDAELASLYSLYILALSQNNLSQVSFRLFNLSRPDRFQYEDENLSTEVTDEDLANAWTDEYGVKYSADRKRLLKVPLNVKEYTVRQRTKVICDKAFPNVIDVEYEEVKSHCEAPDYLREIVKMGSNIENIIIPTGVILIGKGAFSDCNKLRSIFIGKGIKVIGDYAFAGCSSLSSISLPSSVVTIGKGAFLESGINSIVILDGLRIIGSHAFEKCKNLTSISIPTSISEINSNVFKYCENLTTVLMPDSITKIGNSAFMCCKSLSTISLSNKLIEIGKKAFIWSGLKSITIPDQVKRIGNQAFSGCSQLKTIAVSPKNKYFDSRNNCNAIIETDSSSLLSGCSTTTIPNDIISIGDSSFYDFKDLKTIIIPNGVKVIGNKAFDECRSLSSIKIPRSMEEIGSWAFAGCRALKSIYFSNRINKIGKDLFLFCNDLPTIYIPHGEMSKFEVLLPEYKDKLVEQYDEENLSTEVTDEDLVNAWTDEYGVKYSADKKKLLQAPKDIVEYTIKDGTLIICEDAFSWNEHLKQVTIPNSVTTIGDYSFSMCRHLSVINIPHSIISIGKKAFWWTYLKQITIPDSVIEIGDEAFSYCLSLTKIVLPGSVIKIGRNTFYESTNLERIVIPSGLLDRYVSMLPNNKYQLRENRES
jgi:serine/threonine protein kinase